ncbi:MAG TPA: hypothetical protein VD978_35025 [Azospirillum sp.]|nr:hypothetical protein [Azospirillum sp.]
MNHERFTTLLDTYGTDLARWPAPERGAAERLLATAPDAQAAWRAARDVEQLLAMPPGVDGARIDRLVAAVARHAREIPRATFLMLLFGRMPVRFVGVLCAGLLALGWMAGSLHPRLVPATDVALLTDDVPTLFDGGPR